MVPLIGYVDRVSSEFGDAYRADLVRIIHGDANPDRSRMTAEHRSESQLRTTAGGAVFSVGSIFFAAAFAQQLPKQHLADAGKRSAAVPYQVNFCLDPMRPLRLRRLPGT